MTVLPSRLREGGLSWRRACMRGLQHCHQSLRQQCHSARGSGEDQTAEACSNRWVVELLSCWVVELRPVIFLPPFTSHNAHFWLSAAELKIVHTIWSAANNHTQWIHPMTKTWTTWCWFLHFFFLTSCLYQRFHVTHIWFLRFHRNSSVYTSNNLHAEGTSGCDRKWHIYTR